jgi:hypothetical protein
MREARRIATTLGSAFVLLAFLLPSARGDELVTLPTRPGVIRFYLLVPARSAPKAIAVMFPGGFGQVKLPTDGSLPRLGPRMVILARRPRPSPRSRPGCRAGRIKKSSNDQRRGCGLIVERE